MRRISDLALDSVVETSPHAKYVTTTAARVGKAVWASLPRQS